MSRPNQDGWPKLEDQPGANAANTTQPLTPPKVKGVDTEPTIAIDTNRLSGATIPIAVDVDVPEPESPSRVVPKYKTSWFLIGMFILVLVVGTAGFVLWLDSERTKDAARTARRTVATQQQQLAASQARANELEQRQADLQRQVDAGAKGDKLDEELRRQFTRENFPKRYDAVLTADKQVEDAWAAMANARRSTPAGTSADSMQLAWQQAVASCLRLVSEYNKAARVFPVSMFKDPKTPPLIDSTQQLTDCFNLRYN